MFSDDCGKVQDPGSTLAWGDTHQWRTALEDKEYSWQRNL
jgi:hypothetical protein